MKTTEEFLRARGIKTYKICKILISMQEIFDTVFRDIENAYHVRPNDAAKKLRLSDKKDSYAIELGR